jgi:hypothetical protein
MEKLEKWKDSVRFAAKIGLIMVEGLTQLNEYAVECDETHFFTGTPPD